MVADDCEAGGQGRQDRARAHCVVGPGWRRSQDHGHPADLGLARRAEEGRLERSAIST